MFGIRSYISVPALLLFLTLIPFLTAGAPTQGARLAGRLLGHTYVGTFPSGTETLESIDPETGEASVVGVVPNSGSIGVPQGVAALDVHRHRYFFPGDGRLLGLDTKTGAEVVNVPLAIALSAMEFKGKGEGRGR